MIQVLPVRTRSVRAGRDHSFSSSLGPLPGLVHQETVSRAGEVLHVATRLAVDALPLGLAHGQEVGPQAPDGVLGDIGQRLARTGPEHVAPHGLVDARRILGTHGRVLDARHVNGKALTTDDLQQKRVEYNNQLVLKQARIDIDIEAFTYHDQRGGDHDSAQQLVGYGVLFERVSDGLIAAEEAPFERVVLRREDKKW